MLVKECKDAFVLAEGEEVLMVAPMTTSHIDDEAGVVGDLTITSKNVHWISKEADGRGSFQVDFFSLLMHALSRDTTHFASECIYCQIGSADDEESTELRLVPADAAQRKCVRVPTYCLFLSVLVGLNPCTRCSCHLRSGRAV
jgi:hypothetical protein